MKEMNHTHNLDEILTFISANKKNPHVTRIRLYLHYPLVDEKTHHGLFGEVEPTIRFQAINDSGQVFDYHDEHFGRYAPLETRTNPERIRDIGQRLNFRVEGIKDHILLEGLTVELYSQNPPSVEIFNGQKTKETEIMLEDVPEGVVSFVDTAQEIKKKFGVTGVRVYTQYPLVDERGHRKSFGMVIPVILCQTMQDNGQIFGHHNEPFERYKPIDTKRDEERMRIGENVEQRARLIAAYILSQNLRAILYLQNPPSLEIFDGQQKRINFYNPRAY